MALQMRHVALVAGVVVVQADDLVAVAEQSVAEVRTQEARSAGDEDAFAVCHRDPACFSS